MRQILLATATLGLALATAATASSWSGGNGNWNSDSSPGWNGTGVPNSQGAVALFHNIANAKVTQDDVAGVTVGQFIRTGTASGDINFTGPGANAIGIVFDMDGDGLQHAVVSNATTRRISMSNTGYVLNDDLDLVNAVEGVAANTYCISISGIISGTGKNLTLDNVVNAPGANAIALTGANTFTGNVLIRRGGVRLGKGNSLGNGTNPVSLGENGCGGATLALYGSSVSIAYPITLAAEPGGVLRLCSFIDSNTKTNWNHILRGPVAMASPLVVESPRFAEDAFTGSFDFKGILSGAGSLTKTGPGLVTLQAANTYTGGTTVQEGTLFATANGRLGTGDVAVAPGATLSLASGSAVATTANLSLGTTGDAFGKMDLGANATVKTLAFGTRRQPKGTYGATGSGAATIDDRHFSGNGVLTVLEGPPLSTVLFLR